jgi:hypothetical protein
MKADGVPKGVVWMRRLLGIGGLACCCCCLGLDARCRWSRLSVEPFLMDRAFTEPLFGTTTQDGLLVHVNLLLGAAGEVVMACRLETTACCIVVHC